MRLHRSVPILFLVLFTSSSRAQDEWTFLPGKPLFQALLASPQEPHIGIAWRPSQGAWEGSAGGMLELLLFKTDTDLALGLGIHGNARFLMDGSLFSGSQQVLDWSAGPFLDGTLGLFSFRFRWFHQKSTLGDGLEGQVQPFFYSRDHFTGTFAIRPLDGLRIHAGFGTPLWWDDYPLEGSQNFWISGLEYETAPFELLGPTRVFGAFHGAYKDEIGGVWNGTLMAGLAWDLPAGPVVRLGALWHEGNSEYGQFHRQKDGHWGLFMGLEP